MFLNKEIKKMHKLPSLKYKQLSTLTILRASSAEMYACNSSNMFIIIIISTAANCNLLIVIYVCLQGTSCDVLGGTK